MDSHKQQFYKNPTINPKTKQIIKIGDKTYKKLVEKYGEPSKIKSPLTNKKISINKGEYKKLIKKGYTDNDLIGNNINQYLPNDIIYEILLRSNTNTFKNLYIINKYIETICRTQNFWYQKFKYDQLPELRFVHHSFEDYKQLKNIKGDIKGWINVYEDLLKYKIETDQIILVNKIEKRKLNKRTKGIMILETRGEYETCDQFYYIPTLLIDKIKEQIENINYNIVPLNIEMTLLDKDKYNVKCTILENKSKKLFRANINLNEKIIKDIICLYLFDATEFFDHSIEIVDDKGYSFRYFNHKLGNHEPLMMKLRYNTYETLQYNS